MNDFSFCFFPRFFPHFFLNQGCESEAAYSAPSLTPPQVESVQNFGVSSFFSFSFHFPLLRFLSFFSCFHSKISAFMGNFLSMPPFNSSPGASKAKTVFCGTNRLSMVCNQRSVGSAYFKPYSVLQIKQGK